MTAPCRSIAWSGNDLLSDTAHHMVATAALKCQFTPPSEHPRTWQQQHTPISALLLMPHAADRAVCSHLWVAAALQTWRLSTARSAGASTSAGCRLPTTNVPPASLPICAVRGTASAPHQHFNLFSGTIRRTDVPTARSAQHSAQLQEEPLIRTAASSPCRPPAL